MIGSRQYALLKTLQKATDELASTEFGNGHPSAASVHKTLMTLQQRRLVGSKMSLPRRMRGGKSRRLFRITKKGEQAVGRYEASFI